MAQKKVDVLIIGSGHTGGMAAKILTEKGISCTMLDAGPMLNFEKYREMKPVHELPYRGFDAPGRLPHVFQASEFNANQWVDEKVIPYYHPPEQPYNWVRVRSVGGRSPFWARQSFRLSDYEFKCKDHDGFGENWPLSLKDVAPYYSRVEEIFRVTGHKDGLPQYPDGNFVEDNSPWSGAMQRFVDAGEKLGVPVTKPRSSLGKDGLASSLNLLIPDAVATGKLTTIPNAIVRKITVDKNTAWPMVSFSSTDTRTARWSSRRESLSLLPAPWSQPVCCSSRTSVTPAAPSVGTCPTRSTGPASSARFRRHETARRPRISWEAALLSLASAIWTRRPTASFAAML